MKETTIITVSHHSYEISNTPAMEEALDDEYVLCLGEVYANARPEHKDNQVPFTSQWTIGNNCHGCRKILATTDPKLIKKGIKKLETT